MECRLDEVGVGVDDMKLRLIAGTINHWPDDGEWQNYHLDINPRTIWDREASIGVLPDFVGDIATLVDLRDEMFDEVRCHHVLEHLPSDRAVLAVESFYRVLKTDGVLDIEVPNAAEISRQFTHGDIDLSAAQQWLLGEQLPNHGVGDSHHSLWTDDLLGEVLLAAGFVAANWIDAGMAARVRVKK